MNENQSKPEENLPDQKQPPLPPAQPTPTLTNQPQQKMEVHHHGHVHEKKKWKEYVFQFVMLLLAIFLGFQAENFRERISEKHIERDYIESLLIDLEGDITVIDSTDVLLSKQIHGIDTIQTLLTYDLTKNDSTIFNCYYYSTYLQLSFPVNFNERTITQLLSSGAMRFLKENNTADRVTEYFNIIRTADIQKQLYIDNINKCIEAMYNVYDITYLRRKITDNDSLVFVNNDWTNIRFVTTDRGEIKKLTTRLEITKLLIHGYKVYLGTIKLMATYLMGFLREEYHIKEK